MTHQDQRAAATDSYHVTANAMEGAMKGSLQDSMADFGRIRFTIERHGEKLITFGLRKRGKDVGGCRAPVAIVSLSPCVLLVPHLSSS